MIPNVFISSTIDDLAYLRDAIRNQIEEIGLRPVMSEHGEVGYSPQSSAEQSCYETIQSCQLAVFIVGKRYGSIGQGGLSITHNEYRTARDQNRPHFCLVDHDVLAFKRLWERNREKPDVEYPGLQNPVAIFEFVDEVASGQRNNSILPFDSAPSARQALRQQLAHYFGNLLARHEDPVKAELRDILSEVRALKIKTGSPSRSDRIVLRGLRLVLEDRYEPYRTLLDALAVPFEEALPVVLEEVDFEGAMRKLTGRTVRRLTAAETVELVGPVGPEGRKPSPALPLRWYQIVRSADDPDALARVLGVTAEREVAASAAALEVMVYLHQRLVEEAKADTPIKLQADPKGIAAASPWFPAKSKR